MSVRYDSPLPRRQRLRRQQTPLTMRPMRGAGVERRGGDDDDHIEEAAVNATRARSCGDCSCPAMDREKIPEPARCRTQLA